MAKKEVVVDSQAVEEKLEKAEVEYLNKLTQQETLARNIAVPYRAHIAEKYQLRPKDQITVCGKIVRFVEPEPQLGPRRLPKQETEG